MVREGCGDCARRLPQKTKTPTKTQTKRAIMTLNLRGSMLSMPLLPWKPQGAVLVAGAQAQAFLGGTLGEVILAGPELLAWGRGAPLVANVRRSLHPGSKMLPVGSQARRAT